MIWLALQQGFIEEGSDTRALTEQAVWVCESFGEGSRSCLAEFGRYIMPAVGGREDDLVRVCEWTPYPDECIAAGIAHERGTLAVSNL